MVEKNQPMVEVTYARRHGRRSKTSPQTGFAIAGASLYLPGFDCCHAFICGRPVPGHHLLQSRLVCHGPRPKVSIAADFLSLCDGVWLVAFFFRGVCEGL